MDLITTEKRLIKSVSGRLFWEGHPQSDSIPQWFRDARDASKLKVNCLTISTIYLRSDGLLFHLTPLWPLIPEPLVNAIGNCPENQLRFIRGVFRRDGKRFPKNDDKAWEFIEEKEAWMYEVAEYVPDESCNDRLNLWKVAVTAKRTGRFLYAAKRSSAKSFLEAPASGVPWIFSPKFDQFTEEYEKRYRERVARAAREDAEHRRTRRQNTRTFNFNFGDLVAPRDRVDHYEVLGIARSAGPREIKAAYWGLARQYHPDLNPGDPDAEENFKLLSMSYQELMGHFC